MATKNNKRPVILLVRNAAKYDFGGAETYPISVASILKSNGFNPIVVSRSKKVLDHASRHSINSYKGWWWSRQNWSGPRVLLTPIYILWQVVLVFWYIYLIMKTNAQAIHIQSKDDFIAGTLAGRMLRRRVIWTDHMDLRYILQNINRPLRNPVGKLVYTAAKFSNHIILISKNEYKLVTAHFKNKASLADKLVLINNGVLDQYANYPHNKHRAFAFCIASRMVINKGVGEAIQAYISFKNKKRDSRSTVLNIYGDGADIRQFKSLATGHDDIIFHGHSHDAVAKIAASDVFILPSYQEGLSITLLEATMLGKAIIATNVDSNPEVVTNNVTGLLVNVRDTEDLSRAMDRLYSNPKLLHKFEKNARVNYEHNFNLEKIVLEKIAPLYK